MMLNRDSEGWQYRYFVVGWNRLAEGAYVPAAREVWQARDKRHQRWLVSKLRAHGWRHVNCVTIAGGNIDGRWPA